MRKFRVVLAVAISLAAVSLGAAPASPDVGDSHASADGVSAQGPPSVGPLEPEVTEAVAFAETPPLSELPPFTREGQIWTDPGERGSGPVGERGHRPDGALQSEAASSMPDPLFTFEGPSNADNADIFGFRVVPPDPVGDVGLNHYVAMVNLNFAVYSKQGDLLFGPVDTGTLWQDFEVEDCTDPSGDPIVIYDEIANRWVLTQFTTRGFQTGEFFNCVAVSQTQDPTGAYFLYAFSTGENFPDFPKYGLWPNGYYITTREFAPDNSESIGVYAVDRRQMLTGKPDPRMVSFQLTEPSYLVGDGLLPADLDGKRMPPARSPAYLLGTMDDDAFDGAPFDGLNFFEVDINWAKPEQSTFTLTKQIPIAPFDTIFPCAPSSRNCIPQPGVSPAQFVDILSYRQRPVHRLAYRNFGTHESLVTNQSVEARPGVAGMRWWEIRNPSDPVLHQEGTWAPDDGVHRWMGSIAMDKQGNAALGYSVSNATDVFPGIRYAGRLAGDPLGELAQGEAVLQDGSGSQLTTAGRWGDYTSMNVDPKDGCTFYYINQYYEISELAAWQTRIGAFRFPGCT